MQNQIDFVSYLPKIPKQKNKIQKENKFIKKNIQKRKNIYQKKKHAKNEIHAKKINIDFFFLKVCRDLSFLHA